MHIYATLGVLLLSGIISCFGSTVDLEAKANKDWYKKSILYQIYPRSFKDSDGDGIGDLRGVLDKFELLVDAGVTAIWCSPIFMSPQVDQGYDISDYKTVDPLFGTNDDFKELITKAHKAGIKVLIDFVPNHTSDQHAWFNKSIYREDGYEDIYVWIDPKYDEDGNRQAPNNWLSVFGGGAWEWNEIRQQYFLHQFTVQQPDLNFRSNDMMDAMKDVMTYWLDFGADGFRIDAVPFFVEEANLTDEPLIPGCTTLTDYHCYSHIYTKNLPETFDVVYEFRKFMDNYTDVVGGDPRIIVTEAYASRDLTKLYYASEDLSRLGAHYTFNFDLIMYLNSSTGPSELAEVINWWQININETWTRNWVLGNHDRHRVASRLGNPDAWNMLVVGFLPGVGASYYGEEIGMEDGNVTCAQGQDPKAKNCSTFDAISRDFERTPYQWDTSKNAGFSDGNTTWLPVCDKYLTNNLEEQNVIGTKSHYHVYKASTKFHEKLAAKSAKLNYVEINTLLSEALGDVFISYRQFNDTCTHNDPYVFLFNMSGNETTVVDIPLESVVTYDVEVTGTESQYEARDTIYAEDGVTLLPGEAIILKAKCRHHT